MRKIWNKGHRIRASDKHLVYHFSIGTLLFVFVAVLLLLNMKQFMRTDWEHFSLFENGLTLSPYNFITILIATGVCALVAFLYYRFCYDSFKKLLHRQKLARMILENKWYEADTVQDSGFFTDLQSRSREKIVWFPKIYYQMEKGLLHIRCEITLGKYQDQLLRLEDKLESGLYCELTETITVANKNLKLKGYDTKSYWNSITNTGRFVVVLPDKYVQGLEVSENHLIIDTKEDTDAELENKIKEDMQHQLVKVDENGEINDESYRVNVRGAEIEQQKAMVAIVVSLFMYIAFILISAVGTILAVQSLSDSTKYEYRYLTLRRLGINDMSLFKTIRKQLLILFCVPAISAILCSFVMMSSLNNVYQQILGDKHLYLMYFGLNLIIFFLIYSIYWIATYIGFKRNINEAS